MESIDLILDIVFLLLGIIAMVFVIVKRKVFDIWIGFSACAAWVLRGARFLCYDSMVIIIKNIALLNNPMLYVQNTSKFLLVFDVLINLFLYAALARVVLLALFQRWHKKAIKKFG